MVSVNLLESPISKIKNIPHKLKREIYKVPLLQTRREKIYQDLLQAYTQYLPKLNDDSKQIVQELKEHGTSIISLSELNFNASRKMLETSWQLVDKFKDMTGKPNHNCRCLDFDRTKLINYPEVYLWGLEEKLLDIVENYIGLPIIYQGFAMRKDFADGEQVGVRRWHLDWEDRRVIKIIIYLNDVDLDGGPYEYIDRQLTSETIKSLNYYNLGHLSDKEMELAVPRSRWQPCIGPATTVVISDPSSIFHHAKPPTKQDRIALTFCYTSCQPQVNWKPLTISQQRWKEIDRQINERQKRCLGKTLKVKKTYSTYTAAISKTAIDLSDLR